MALAGRQHVVVWLLLLQDQPHSFDIVARMSPVARGIEIAEVHSLLQAMLDRRHRARDLAGDESFAADRALVVEQDPVRGMYPVGFAVIDCDPMSVKLRRRIRRARVKRRCFVLRDLLSLAKQLGCRGLIESSLVLAAENANGFEQAQSTDTVGVDSVFRRFERDLYMRLRGEIINFIRLRFLHDADDVGRIRHIAVMQMEGNASLVRLAYEMVDTGG